MGLLTFLRVAVALSSIALRAKEDALRLVGQTPDVESRFVKI